MLQAKLKSHLAVQIPFHLNDVNVVIEVGQWAIHFRFPSKLFKYQIVFVEYAHAGPLSIVIPVTKQLECFLQVSLPL